MRKRQIERDPMIGIKGIIVHQTESPTAASTLNAYSAMGANGAHFLIARDGTIIQTASLRRQTKHVGNLRSRCVAEKRCSAMPWGPTAEHKRERVKRLPDRYPTNAEAIGIEIVGEAFPKLEINQDKRVFEPVSEAQNASLKWLISMLVRTIDVPESEIFRHPMVSTKNKTEASTAKW